MSLNLNDLFKAFDDVRSDFTCFICKRLCVKPLTLNGCFHTICTEHYNSLKCCPECNMEIQNTGTFVDTGFERSIEYTKKLEDLFKCYRNQNENINKNTTINSSINKVTHRKVLNSRQNTSTKTTKTDSLLLNTHGKIGNKLKLKKELPNTNSTEKKVDTSFSSTTKLNRTHEKRNSKGETEFHIACRLGKMEKAVQLLNNGINVNTKDNAGWTPLHEVVQNGNLDLVVLLLHHNALINVPGPGNETPLHEAVRFDHSTIVVELIKNGADYDMQNCKGETPLQLASDHLKPIIKNAIEHVVKSQSNNISLISDVQTNLDFENMHIYCLSINKIVLDKLKSFKQSHNVHLESKFTKKVTHLIVDTNEGTCETSFHVLQAVVNHLWILSSDWVLNSNDDHLESLEEYEIKGVGSPTNCGPKTSRFNKYKQLPAIFNGCHFYLHNFTGQLRISDMLVLNKVSLTKLITDAGGIVLKRIPNPESISENEKLIPFHAKKDGKLAICSHFIIFKDTFQPMYNMAHFKALPIGWLIECFEKYELCEPW